MFVVCIYGLGAAFAGQSLCVFPSSSRSPSTALRRGAGERTAERTAKQTTTSHGIKKGDMGDLDFFF